MSDHTSNLRRTPLFDEHVKLGGRMVPFAGWEMPVQYKGLREEHTAVRTAVGFFDVSHMGEVRVSGPHALPTLQWLTSNDVSVLKKNQAQYSLLMNKAGGIVDDLIVYCIEPEREYLLCVNAANTEKDWAHIQQNNKGAELRNESSIWGQIAVQGPKTAQVLAQALNFTLDELPPFHIQPHTGPTGQSVWIARTGYTGEIGVEIFVPAQNTVALWLALLRAGQGLGGEACGLGARDTLRTEMKYSLYGQELTDDTNAYAAGLGWVVKPTAKDFLGRGPLLSAKENGLKQKLVGFQLVDKGIPRAGYRILDRAGQPVGQVTSGTLSPSLDRSIGIGYVNQALAAVGSEIWVDIRGRAVKSTVVETPFWKREN
jgi:aminomethyltransferase